MFSIIMIGFLFLAILIPVNKMVNGIKKDIKPKDWKKMSDIKLPFIPNKFLISVFSLKIKLGSSGE